MLDSLNFTDFLKVELEQRQIGNSRYSLRAFARDLEMSPSRLSEVMNGKGSLSYSSALKVGKNLNLTEKEMKIFTALVNLKNSSSKKSKNDAHKYLKNICDKNTHSLSQDTFSLISEWYYFAILSVLELDECNGQSHWIAKRLNLNIRTTEDALSKLLTLSMVEKTEAGWRLPEEKVSFQTTNEIQSISLRKSHKQSLYQAINSIENHSIEHRDITSITMAIDKNKIPQAKKLIREFRSSLCEFMESGSKNEVYNLNIQLVPLTEQKKGVNDETHFTIN
ncbi:MAG: hypothetical protein CME69_06315 [Halobacteriovorax sp.]|nr:hypothetical protein [Halobacteriovorax sp.]|tara:strand:- start:415 stop:1251 length:837 start_codon:yes stop_codon:yes gene_type:complete